MAGKLNGLSQSAVSQQLRTLESHFNIQIIDHSQKHFHLAREGEYLYEASQKILDIYNSFVYELQEKRNLVDGTIHLSTITSIGLHELPSVLRSFLSSYPAVDFRVEYRRSDAVLEDVDRRNVDFGLLANPDAEAAKKFTILPFAEDKLVLICSPKSPFANRQSIKVAELEKQRFIGFDSDVPTHKIIEKALKSKDVHLMTVMESDNVETIKRAVEVGIGVALVPAATIEQEVQHGTLAKVELSDCHIKRSLVIVHRKGFGLTPAMKQFIRFMTATEKQPTTTSKTENAA